MFKKIVFFFLIIPVFAYTGYSLEMNQLPNITDPGVEAYRNYLFDTPPEIKNVDFFPYSPKSTDGVTVKALIFNDPQKTEIETVSASLFYSVDGGETYTEISMEQDEKNPCLWIATIPPQKPGTQVNFYIRAVDSVGNIATEMPAEVKNWPPDDKTLALTSLDDDDKDQVVSDEMDILSTYAGYDEEYFYVKMVMQKNISEGDLQKPFLNAYGVGILNMEKGSDILGGYLLAYVPYFNKLINYPKCIFYDTGRISFVFDAGAVEIVDKNNLYMKVKRQSLGKADSKTFKLLYGTVGVITKEIFSTSSATGVTPGLINFLEESIKRLRENPTFTLNDFENFKKYLDFKDATNYSVIYLRNHSYLVEE